jgi:hypothetical protein
VLHSFDDAGSSPQKKGVGDVMLDRMSEEKSKELLD